MLAYAIVFKILMIDGQLVTSIIEVGGKLGIKSKKEDNIGRILKGLSKILILWIIVKLSIFNLTSN